MQLARFWSKVESTAQTPAGKSVPFACWRGSAHSAADANRLAREAAERMAARISNGEWFPQRYAYPGRLLREEVLQEIHGAHGDVEAALTRNAYGAEVLNAGRLLFIDVDLPSPSAGALAANLLGRLAGALLGSRSAALPADPLEAAHVKRRQWLAEHPQWGMRIYRTRSGLRYLVTHALFEPGGAEAEAAMQFLGCDPAYLQLCRSQKSFRARLTPKPWRCGADRPAGRFPFEGPAEQEQMAAWRAEYEVACQPYASCALLEVCGNRQIHPAVPALLNLHDERSRAESGLPLA